MSPIRRLAVKLLHGVRLHAPPQSQEWAQAMLQELDFIENDWSALFWALGSSRAIFKHSGLRGWFGRRSAHQEESVNQIGKRAVGVLSGMTLAFLLVLGAFGLLWLGFYLFPSWGLDRLEWTHWLTIIVIPEAIFIVAAIKLWRKRPSVAAGIVVFAVVLVTHFGIHVATHPH